MCVCGRGVLVRGLRASGRGVGVRGCAGGGLCVVRARGRARV